MPLVLHINKRAYRFSNKENNNTVVAEKITRYRNERGCASGAIFMSIALIMLAVYLSLHWQRIELLPATLAGVLFIFVCTAAGKLLGMVAAKIQLSLLYKSLIERRYIELIE